MNTHQSEQDRLWRFYQNEGLAYARFAAPRQHYMIRHCRPRQQVLNIGVGNGLLERLAVQKGVDIYAVDPDPNTVERLRTELQLGEKAQVSYAHALPFPDDTFDVVIMAEVLEHLDDETLIRSLHEVRRVVKPGGFLLASTPYREDIERRKVLCPHCGSFFHPFGHVQQFDKPRMRSLLEAAGYSPVKLTVTTFVSWTPHPLRILKSAVRLMLARLGESIADPRLVARAYKRASG